MATSPDPRTLGWLQRALTHELRAVQQYLAQSVLARLWGDLALAEEFRREAIEELEHAERLMAPLIIAGVAPNAAALPPARLGRTAQELMAADQRLEQEAVLLYADALDYAKRRRDENMARLFAELLEEEARHAQKLEALSQGGDESAHAERN